jgi:UDP-glucuronate 4-epimerase
VSRYVVTGCAGFIGSHLSEALLQDGHEVAGLDAFTDAYERGLKERNLALALEHSRFSLTETDLAYAELDAALDGADGVFHLAAQPGVRGSFGSAFETYLRRNVLATQRVLEAAAAQKARVVLASSSSIYGEALGYPTPEDVPARPISPYGVTKLACEHLSSAYAATQGVEVVVLRYFTVYGPRQRPDMAFSRIGRAVREGTPFQVLGDGGQSRDFTYVGDAVAATLAAFERAPAARIYNVGGGTEVSLLEAVALAERIAGRPIPTERGPAAPGDVRRTSADTGRIRAEVGWAPVTSLAEGLAAQLEADARPFASFEAAPNRG